MKHITGNKWATLAIISFGFFMILLDTTIVNVSIPTIIKDLHATLADIEWIISGYALSFAALLITFGRFGDMFGRKKLFLLGLAVFIVASFFSGEASNASTLIIARLFQGVGGAMLSPATLSILSNSFRGRERALAFGLWGAIAGIAVAVGPVLGGIFTTYSTWRWIFRVNIPVGIVAMLLGILFVAESKEEAKKRFDISGMISSTIGFFLLVFALIEGQNYGWVTESKDFVLGNFTWKTNHISIILISGIISIIFLALFILIQVRKSKKGLEPAVNTDFFQFRTYRYGLIALSVIALGEFSSLFTIPIFLQGVKGFTPLESGYAILPMATATFFAAPISARIVNIIGSKLVIFSGIFLESIGLFLLSFLHANSTYQDLLPGFILLGIGIGLAIAQNTQVVLSEIPPEHSGSASGVVNTIRQVGSALGIAIIGAILSWQITTLATTNIGKIDGLSTSQKNAIVTNVNNNSVSFNSSSQTEAVHIAPPASILKNPFALQAFAAREKQIGEEVKDAIYASLSDAIGFSIRLASGFVFLGALLSLFIPNIHHKREEEIS